MGWRRIRSSHPLYSLADPLVSSSQPVSLFAASPGKSLLFCFLWQKKKNVGLLVFFGAGGVKKPGNEAGTPHSGDPNSQHWKLKGREMDPQNHSQPPPPHSVPALDLTFFKNPTFFCLLFATFLTKSACLGAAPLPCFAAVAAAAALLCTLIPAEDKRTPGPPTAPRRPLSTLPPKSPSRTPKTHRGGDADPKPT